METTTASNLKIGTEFMAPHHSWCRVIGLEKSPTRVKVIAVRWNDPPKAAFPDWFTYAPEAPVKVRRP